MGSMYFTEEADRLCEEIERLKSRLESIDGKWRLIVNGADERGFYSRGTAEHHARQRVEDCSVVLCQTRHNRW